MTALDDLRVACPRCGARLAEGDWRVCVWRGEAVIQVSCWCCSWSAEWDSKSWHLDDDDGDDDEDEAAP